MDWSYESWPSGEPYDWGGAGRGHTIFDAQDYHVDLGCGTCKKGRIGVDRYPAPGVNVVMNLDRLALFGAAPEPGRDACEALGGGGFRLFTPGRFADPPHSPDYFDYPHPDAELYAYRHGALPFKSGEIESIISHHCLEHIGDGFLPLMDEVYRVLKRGGIFYAITPLFPSRAAVEDPDHKRYFMCNEKTCTWDSLCGHLGDENNPTGSWLDSFSVPYTKARFEMVHRDWTAPLPPEKQWGPDDVREMRIALRAVK